jgi:hypothetical protein
MGMIQLAIIATLLAIAIAPFAALADTACIAPGAPAGEGKGESLTGINKKLTNPLGDAWSISFQQNNYRLGTVSGQGDKWSSNLNFQPVIPVSLTKDWNLITGPVKT